MYHLIFSTHQKSCYSRRTFLNMFYFFQKLNFSLYFRQSHSQKLENRYTHYFSCIYYRLKKLIQPDNYDTWFPSNSLFENVILDHNILKQAARNLKFFLLFTFYVQKSWYEIQQNRSNKARGCNTNYRSKTQFLFVTLLVQQPKT